jgi:hypothetical protein
MILKFEPIDPRADARGLGTDVATMKEGHLKQEFGFRLIDSAEDRDHIGKHLLGLYSTFRTFHRPQSSRFNYWDSNTNYEIHLN